MYRKVLLCYDGTAEGRKALREGAEIAYATGAEAHLLAICRSLVASSLPEGVTPELVARGRHARARRLRGGCRTLAPRGGRSQAQRARRQGAGLARVRRPDRADPALRRE